MYRAVRAGHRRHRADQRDQRGDAEADAVRAVAAAAGAAGEAQLLLSRLQRVYRRAGERLRRHRSAAWSSAAGSMVVIALRDRRASALGYARCRPAFMPIEDQGYLMLAVQLPDGASLERTDASLEQLDEIARRSPASTSGHHRRRLGARQQRHAGQRRRDLRHPQGLGRARKGKGQDLLSLFPELSGDARRVPGRRRVTCSRRRRSRASAMPAASR